ncbi:MAG: hypothetical protein II996_03235 [Oscillospiraceae bacterium]|nr:hypothetical protein [Oscillospiraceae bacterium]
MNALRNKKLFLLDMDGTIYLDNDIFDGTLDFLSHVKSSGGRYVFLTNNSSKGVDKYIEKLEDACILLRENIDYIATNPDWVCPTWYGFVPDCGSFADMIYNATKKRPRFIGKPQPEFIYENIRELYEDLK